MQLPWSRIWTRFAVSISYDDNHYTTITIAPPRLAHLFVFLLVNYYKIWFPGWDLLIYLYFCSLIITRSGVLAEIDWSIYICLVLYSFFANLFHSLIMRLINSSLSLTHICCFVASYLFSLSYGLSLWRCFVLLFEEIQFLT